MSFYSISFCSDKHLTVGISFDYDCYEGIRTAVTKSHKSGVDVKAKLGKELIGILDQMFHVNKKIHANVSCEFIFHIFSISSYISTNIEKSF